MKLFLLQILELGQVLVLDLLQNMSREILEFWCRDTLTSMEAILSLIWKKLLWFLLWWQKSGFDSN